MMKIRNMYAVKNTFIEMIANRIGITRLNINEKKIKNISEVVLNERYKSIVAKKSKDNMLLNEINQHEFKLHSQNGEDGILLHIFSKIGVKNNTFVELGVGDGRRTKIRGSVRTTSASSEEYSQ